MIRRLLLPLVLLAAAAAATVPWIGRSTPILRHANGLPRWKRRVMVDGAWYGELRRIRDGLPGGARVALLGVGTDTETRRILAASVYHLYPLRATIFGRREQLDDARLQGRVPSAVFLEVDPTRPTAIRKLSDEEIRPARRLVLPFAAELDGQGGIRYRTRLRLTNADDFPLRIDLQRREVGKEPERRRIDLAAGETRTYERLLGELFGKPGIAAIELRGADRLRIEAELVADFGSRQATSALPIFRTERFSERQVLTVPAAGPAPWRFWGIELSGQGAHLAVRWTRGKDTASSSVNLGAGGLELIAPDAARDWQGGAETRIELEETGDAMIFASRRLEPALETEMIWPEPAGKR